MAIATSALEMRSPAVSSMSSLARRRRRADLLGQVEQVVGGVAHRRDDHDDVVARLLGLDDALGDAPDPVGVATEDPPYFCTTSATLANLRGLGYKSRK